ncbi:Protein of unknown function DUF569 [Macleaya cordata]|uniref:Actin cross-linking n=1 Tax=Macleaya cordata TaxID=56857 RepID=A0A200QNM7_MACCD|nr:Protein of unknown function DUF569 [Macleaya cordata]
MEFFNEAKFVRLRSHLDKYLLAEEDEETIRQSRNCSSRKVRWTVEFIQGKSNVVCLKSCYNKYLTATELPYLFGMTGKKVIQTDPIMENLDSSSIEWEPIRDGFQVNLRTREGKFLRGNGGTPPWRNSVTHDIPYYKSATRNWVLWEVEMVDFSELRSFSDYLYLSPLSSFSSLSEDPLDSPTSPLWSATSTKSFRLSISSKKGMELFQNAKTVRLRSHHDKYLLAEDDQESVCQDRHGSCKNARWTVEFVDGYGSNSVIRLKSCYDKYLTATDIPFFLGVTGKKVLQIVPRRLDSLVEWEPIREGHQVKLKTRYGNYLRANGGLPPWRNSITHDIPHRTATQDWILWSVDILEVRPPPPPPSEESTSPRLSKIESNDSFVTSPPKSDGRTIYYYVADDKGYVDDEDAMDARWFTFKGTSVDELTQKLEEETGVEDIIACTRSSLNGKLYPLRLQLPPNNATMHVIVIKSSSKVAKEFANPDLPAHAGIIDMSLDHGLNYTQHSLMNRYFSSEYGLSRSKAKEFILVTTEDLIFFNWTGRIENLAPS